MAEPPKCALPHCNKPCWTNAGVVHDYCGRTHALEGRNGAVQKPHGKCHICKYRGCDKAVYFERGRVHDFCSRRHAEMAMQNNEWPPPSCMDYTKMCALPGCKKAVFFDEARQISYDYCGRTHSMRANERGLLPSRQGYERCFKGTPLRERQMGLNLIQIMSLNTLLAR